MAYAAQILKQLLQSDHLPVHYPKLLVQSLHENVSSLQSSLEKFILVPKDKEEIVSELERKIRDAIYEAQDTIEIFISKQSETEENPEDQIKKLQNILDNISPITKETKEISDSIRKQPGDSLSGDTVSTKSSFSTKIKIVGQDEDQELIMSQVKSDTSERQIIPIIGLPGIGKTTLARSIYEHKDIVDRFCIRAWVTVSANYDVRDIFLKLHASLENKGPKSDDSGSMKNPGNIVNQESNSQLALDLYKKLHIRYLVVIDDMWHKEVWDELKPYFPDKENGSRIILTTRDQEIADHIVKPPMFRHRMKTLNPEFSWELLCEKAFGGQHHNPHLEKIGRTIAENCQGLPLSLTVVGGLLSQRKTDEYWRIVAEDTKAAAVKGNEAYKEILSLSYKHLPGRLKGCFLYMGAFPEDSEIPVSKLIKLWLSEGLLTPPLPPVSLDLEQVAEQYLKNLVARSLVFVRRKRSDGQIKTCGIHDVLRDIAVEESEKEKFCHAIKRYVPELQEDTHSQRRLSVHKNIFLCVEEVYNSTKELKRARTLLCAGPHHHHPLPFSLTFELLRVLDAFTVYFIRFPTEIVKLIHLRYLSFTYNRKLPSSLSKLRNLQILIVRRHPKIIYMGTSILPVEIWNMPQLRHLVFTESELPPIPFRAENSVLLENLQSLSNVHASCCTEGVLRKIPNLKKLGIWIEAPGVVKFNLDGLKQLEALAFTVLNPDPDTKIEFLPQLAFPETLKKLSLRGCGIPWEDMTVIAQLPNLKVLKLREMAFDGEKWDLDDMVFLELEFLLLEYMHNLKHWEAEDSHFPSLKCLIVRHCYELDGIPLGIGDIGGLELIELVECPNAVKSAQKIREEQKDWKDERIFKSVSILHGNRFFPMRSLQREVPYHDGGVSSELEGAGTNKLFLNTYYCFFSLCYRCESVQFDLMFS